MPLYIYVCDWCAVELEEIKPLWRRDELEACPICKRIMERAATTASLPTGVTATDERDPSQVRHPLGCECCVPGR